MKSVTYTIARSDTGAVLPYASVTVYLPDGVTKAALYDDAGASIGNPLAADQSGNVSFAAANGTYTLRAVSADAVYSVPDIEVQIFDLEALAQAISAGGLASVVSVKYATKAAMLADLVPVDGAIALVYGDSTPLNNDLYYKIGATGAGSWSGTTGLLAGASKAYQMLAQAWAEGTNPAGGDSKSAKEWAEQAADDHAEFQTVFQLGTQEVTGSVIVDLVDLLNRKLFEIDQDATVGIRMFLPLRLVDGTVPMTALDASALAALPFSTGSEADGYAVQFTTADTTRRFGGIPATYPVEPMDVTGMRARYADTFAGATGGGYLLYGVFDASGNQQLYTRKLATGEKAAITTTGHAMSPRIDGTNALWIDGTTFDAMYRPLDGSDSARRVHPSLTTYVIAGDSTGQSLTQGATGAVEGGLASNGREVISISLGSQTTRQVAARYGVPGLIQITFTAGSIPASGSAAVTLDYDPVVGTSSTIEGGMRIEVTSDNGTVVPGVIVRDSTGAFTFERTSAGTARTAVGPRGITITGDMVVAAAAAVPAAALTAPATDRLRGHSLIVRLGRNDLGPGAGKAYSAANTLNIVQALVAHTTPLFKAVIVMGVMQTYGYVPVVNGGTFNSTTGAGAATFGSIELAAKSLFDNDLLLNNALRSAFGANYYDPVQGHKDAGLTSTVTLSSTTYDYVTTAAIADGTHENATGYNNSWAKVFAQLNAMEF